MRKTLSVVLAALLTVSPALADVIVVGQQGVNILSGAGAGGTSAADEATFTAATTAGTAVMGAFDDTAPDTVAEDKLGIARLTTNRAIHVNLRDVAGAEVAVGGGTQYDEDTVSTAADKVTMAGVVRKDTAATLVGTDGDRTQLQVDADGKLHVNPGTVTVASHAVTNAGTFVTQIDGAALTALQVIDNPIFAEDAAHTSTDPGTQVLAVRRDADTSLVDTNGDYAPLQVNSAGSLKVAIISGAGAGGTSATDEAAYTPATTAGTPVMGAADETAPDSAAEGTVGIVRMTLTRAMHVNLRDATGAELAVGGATQYAEDTASTAADSITMAGVVRSDTLASLVGTDGDRTQLQVNASGRLYTSTEAVGTVAHDGVDAGNPVKTGAQAISYGSAPTAAAAADRVNHIADRQGVAFALPFHPNQTVTEYVWTTAQTDDAVITVSAGTRIGVVSYQVLLDEATTVGVGVRCGFGTATLTAQPADGAAAANTFLNHRGIVPGGGLNNPPGFFTMGADDADVRCTTEATTSGTATLVITYFTTAN